jgi:hypothetical protein
MYMMQLSCMFAYGFRFIKNFILGWYITHYYLEEHRNILHEIRERKANWIGHILRRNCLLQRVIEGKIKGGGG